MGRGKWYLSWRREPWENLITNTRYYKNCPMGVALLILHIFKNIMLIILYYNYLFTQLSDCEL